jgi:tetratricopeptide (TPR) repeat protein
MSHREAQELDVRISFMEGVIRRDPHYVEALEVLGDDYTNRGLFVAGLKVDEQLSHLRPADPFVQYNLACSYSLTGDFHQAIAALERAIELGYRDLKWMARDPDLAALRGYPGYRQFRARLRRLRSEKN